MELTNFLGELERGEIEGKLSLNDLIELHSSVSFQYQKMWEDGDNNERLMMGKHWSESQEQEILNQGRNPYSIPIVADRLNRISAMQRKTRTEWKVEAASNPEYEINAELATISLKNFSRLTDWQNVKSEVFDSGIKAKFGAVEFYLETDPTGDTVVKVRNIDYKNCVRDINARRYDGEDGSFKAVLEFYYRKDIREIFGEEAAKKVQLGEFSLDYGRKKFSYWISPNPDGLADLDIITVARHYQKVNRKIYNVIFDDVMNLIGERGNLIIGKFSSKKEAEEALKRAQEPYIKQFLINPGGEIKETTETRIDVYVFTYTGIIKFEETNLKTFPIKEYYSFFFQGKFWCLTDILRDPQTFFDRLMSQIDYSFGIVNKNTGELDVSLLAMGETPETAIKKMNTPRGIILKKGGSQVFSPHRTEGMNPQWLVMANEMRGFINELSSGTSIMSPQSIKASSGRDRSLMQSMDQLLAELFIDNLRRFEHIVGEEALRWKSMFEKSERIIKISGTRLKPSMIDVLMKKGIYEPSKISDSPFSGWITLNKEGIEETWLKGIDEYELIVTDAEISDSDRQAIFAQLNLINQAIPGAIPIELWLQYADLSYSEREDVLTHWQELNQQQELAKQNEDNKEQQKLDTQKARVLASILTKGVKR